MSRAARIAAAMLPPALRTFAIAVLLCIVASAGASAATPAFSVHKNGTAQTIVADTPTKLTWSTEVIDTNTNFATNRFTPTVAGNYLIVVSVQCAQPGACVPAIYKNGALYAASRLTNQTFADQSPQVTAIVSMNGSTDYVEAFATSSGNSIVGAVGQTYFSGTQIDGSGGGGVPAGSVSGAIQFRGSSPVFAADDSNLVWDNTNKRLGVGTDTPGAKIEIAYPNATTGGLRIRDSGSSNVYMDLDVYDGSSAGEDVIVEIDPMGDAASNAHIRMFRSTNTSGETSLLIHQGNGTTSTNTRISGNGNSYLNALAGNVGIGTPTPSTKVEIYGSGQASATLTDAGSRGAILAVNANAAGVNNGGAITFGNTQSLAANSLGFAAIKGLLTNGAANTVGDLSFSTRNASSDVALSERMRIASTGNVGIGTTAPSSTLEVSGTITATNIVAEPPTLIVADEKASSTDGGTCTSGSWATRVLNTVRTNTITGASLATNQITLPAGKYRIEGSAPGFRVAYMQARLYNVTGSVALINGSTEFSTSGTEATTARSIVIGQVTLAAPTVLSLQFRCGSTYADRGLGGSGDWGTEVYSLLEITKVQ